MIFIELGSYQSLSSHQVWNFNSTGSSSGQNENDILDVPKSDTQFRNLIEVVSISVRKMSVSSDSRKMYKSFGT